MTYTDRIKPLLERDASTLTTDEVRTLQWELVRHRKFKDASTHHGARFVLDERHYLGGPNFDAVEFHKAKAAHELGLQIAAGREWLEIPEHYGTQYRLSVSVWPELPIERTTP